MNQRSGSTLVAFTQSLTSNYTMQIQLQNSYSFKPITLLALFFLCGLTTVTAQTTDILTTCGIFSMASGVYTINLDMGRLGLSSGVYIYHMVAEGLDTQVSFTKSQKLLFVK